MPFPNEHAVRLQSPNKFKRFRRVNDKFGKGIDVIYGITKDNKVEIQAVRFDKSKHTIEDVKSHIKKHDWQPVSVTPAKDHSDAPVGASSAQVPIALKKDHAEPMTEEEVADIDIYDEFFTEGAYVHSNLIEGEVDEKQIEMGIKVEYEHTTNEDIARRIALDHLAEIPDYYTRLLKMEKEAKGEN